MIVGAPGCNLACGLIDGGIYLMACSNQRVQNLATRLALRLSSLVATSMLYLCGYRRNAR